SRVELAKTIDNMKNAESSTESLSVATDAFGGEGAQRLTTAVQNGSLSLDDLGDSLNDADGAIAATSDETQSFAEKWKTFKNDIMTQIEPAATALFDKISDGMGWIQENAIPTIKTMAEWLGKNSDWLIPLAGGIGAVVAAIKIWTVVTRIQS